MSDKPLSEQGTPKGSAPRYFRISDEGEILMQDLWVPTIVRQIPDGGDAEPGVEPVRLQRTG